MKLQLLTFEQMYNFGTFLAIAPAYNFKKQTVKNCVLYKCYVVLVGTIILISGIWSMRYRQNCTKKFRTSMRVLDISNDIILLTTYLVMSFESSIFDDKKWSKLLNSIQVLNETFKNDCNNKSFRKFVTVEIILTNCAFFFITSYQWMSFINTDEIQSYFMISYIVHYVNFYTLVYMAAIITAVLHTLYLRFKTLNRKFKKNFISSQKNLRSDLYGGNLVEIIRQVEKFNTIMTEAISNFNDLFGHGLFLIIAHSVFNGIVIINIVIVSQQLRTNSGSDYADVILSSVLATGFIFVSILPDVVSPNKNYYI